MLASRATFIRYAELMSVFSAILNVAKFAMLRDATALKTLAALATATFAMFAVFLLYTNPDGQ